MLPREKFGHPPASLQMAINPIAFRLMLDVDALMARVKGYYAKFIDHYLRAPGHRSLEPWATSKLLPKGLGGSGRRRAVYPEELMASVSWRKILIRVDRSSYPEKDPFHSLSVLTMDHPGGLHPLDA